MRGTRFMAVTFAVAAMAVLTACEPGALDPDASTPATSSPATPSPSTDPGETTSPSEEPPQTPVPTVDPVGGDLDLSCEQVVTQQQVYDLNPNFAATSAPTAEVPAAATAVVDAGGVLCAWQHLTNGDPLFAAVAYASEAPEDAAVDETEGSVYVLGEIVDDYWIVVASPYFTESEPGAADLIAAIASNLPEPEEG